MVLESGVINETDRFPHNCLSGAGQSMTAAFSQLKKKLKLLIDSVFRAREPDEIAREQEPSLNSRSPAPYFREGMDEEENLDFCRYGLIAGSIDVAESGFSASSPLFDHNVNHSNSKASVCEVWKTFATALEKPFHYGMAQTAALFATC